uniref:TOG array regulator of axonemal microtubules 1 n=1 Tax=Sphenodon punctatus TaxID=8508 RepID=A0A8D0GG83_SPHPU
MPLGSDSPSGCSPPRTPPACILGGAIRLFPLCTDPPPFLLRCPPGCSLPPAGCVCVSLSPESRGGPRPGRDRTPRGQKEAGASVASSQTPPQSSSGDGVRHFRARRPRSRSIPLPPAPRKLCLPSGPCGTNRPHHVTFRVVPAAPKDYTSQSPLRPHALSDHVACALARPLPRAAGLVRAAQAQCGVGGAEEAGPWRRRCFPLRRPGAGAAAAAGARRGRGLPMAAVLALPPPRRRRERAGSMEEKESAGGGEVAPQPPPRGGGGEPAGQEEEEGQALRRGRPGCPRLAGAGAGGDTAPFGLVPAELHARLLDQQDYRSRACAVEELKQLLAAAAFPAALPAASLLGLVSFLRALLDDSNFKVVLGALEALRLLAVRLGAPRIQAHLAPLLSAATKVLGDNKLAIRQEYHRLFLGLMKAAGPQRVLALLLQPEHLLHKNSRVREEVVNLSIAALLTYPSENFDLPALASGLAPALVDSKRRVRHAALEAFAILASSMGAGKTSLLFKAVDAVELQDNGDGVMHAVQARLARKTLPKLTEQGFVEYAVPMPSSAHGRGSLLPHGADTDWLLEGNRTRSAHSYCGDHTTDINQNYGALSPYADQGGCPRRVLSAGKGKNKLPWENECVGGSSGNQRPFSKGAEPLSPYNDFLHSPNLRPSQGMAVSDDLFFSRKRPSRNLFQNSLDFNSEQSAGCAGVMEPHQPHISGKCGQLGFSQIRGKSGSVDSDLQFLGLNNHRQDKVCASLNFTSKPQRTFCSPVERTLSFPASNTSSGAFILPSYPLSSPRNSPKHTSPPTESPKKSQAHAVNFSNSWPLKSFEWLPKPSQQKKLPSQKSGENSGDNSQEKHSPIQLKPALVRPPASRRGLNGTKPVPPIPRGASPLPDKADGNTVAHKNDETQDIWMSEQDKKLALDLSELNMDDKEELDQEEMQSSLRSLRNSAAKKRAKLSGSASDLESPDSLLKLELALDSPPRSLSPNMSSYSESGVYSQESAASPVSTASHGKRVITCMYVCISGFTGSTSSLQQVTNLDFVSPSALSDDSVVIVGKGVFGSPPSVPLTCSQSLISSMEKGDVPSFKQTIEPPSGVYGRAVQQNSTSYLDMENEKDMKVSLSKSARDKMRRKRKEEKEQNKREHHEVEDLERKEQNSWERLRYSEPEKMAAESEMLPGPRVQYKDRPPSVPHSPEIMDQSELRPFSKPETALGEALRLLADDDWEKKIEGLNFVRCLSAYHSDVLSLRLHETSLLVVQEVKNLRSGVSRAAVVCLGDLFTYLKRGMDQELDNTVKVLLHKSGESNTFIREDVDKALKAMANNVTPARALCSLINGGQRYYGRKMLFTLMTHPDFDRMLEKYVPSKDLPYIKETVGSLRQKGLGEMPLDAPSAKGRRSHAGSIGSSRSSSTSRDALNVAEREVMETREVTRKPVPRNSLESAEYVRVITGLLNAKDFRDRINGIKQLLADTENNQELVVANIVKIFDAFKSRLHDSNSKVNQVALETMHRMIPLLKDNLSPVINMLIPAMVDNNLNSKNPGIYAAAANVIQALCQHLDNYLLLQPFCTKAQFLNGKAKQDMIEKLAELAVELYPRKPHAVEQKVLAVLWHLLGNMTNSGSLPGAGGNIRTATAKLSKALFAQMGQSLLIQAASQPPHIRKNLEEFLDIAT